MAQYYCSHCGRELRNGERVIVWAPQEEIGEFDSQELVCDMCEHNIAVRLRELLNDEE